MYLAFKNDSTISFNININNNKLLFLFLLLCNKSKIFFVAIWYQK